MVFRCPTLLRARSTGSINWQAPQALSVAGAFVHQAPSRRYHLGGNKKFYSDHHGFLASTPSSAKPRQESSSLASEASSRCELTEPGKMVASEQDNARAMKRTWMAPMSSRRRGAGLVMPTFGRRSWWWKAWFVIGEQGAARSIGSRALSMRRAPRY